VCEENGGQWHNMKTGNKVFASVEQFRYLETAITNQNCIHEEIKSSLKSENSSCHSVRNILFASFLSIDIKINIYRTDLACRFEWV
jgi:hypothetical protein